MRRKFGAFFAGGEREAPPFLMLSAVLYLSRYPVPFKSSPGKRFERLPVPLCSDYLPNRQGMLWFWGLPGPILWGTSSGEKNGAGLKFACCHMRGSSEERFPFSISPPSFKGKISLSEGCFSPVQLLILSAYLFNHGGWFRRLQDIRKQEHSKENNMTNLSGPEYRALKNQILERSFGRLNDKQREAVYTTAGPVLILAGAGSGKTTVLINRVANLLRFGRASDSDTVPALTAGDVELLRRCAADGSCLEEAARLMAVDKPKPWNVLAITFTNKAAGELRQRLADTLGPDGQEVAAATFHSICVRILRSEITALGYKSSFTIYDTDDSVRVIKDCMAELNLSDKNFPPKSFLGIISQAKDRMLSPREVAAQGGDNYAYQTAGKVYDRYQQKLQAANAVDFDDLIVLTVRLFQEYPQVLEKYQKRWKYIMVDEYQDTNHAQYLLVSLLAAAHRNICVVGDDDQSIYKFRGATIENILSFESQFPGAKVIRLEQNYRCTSKILDAANAVISHNLQRKGKTLWTSNGAGENIQVYNAADERGEAAYIARQIRDNVAEGAKYGDHAVLYRMNAQSGTLEQSFIRQEIPYRIVGGLKFFDRKEVKDVLAYLSVVDNPADTLRLRRIINEPKRGIGDATMTAAAEIADTLGITVFDVIAEADQYAPLSKKSGALLDFARMMQDLMDAAEEVPLGELLDMVLDRSGYTAALAAKKDFESQGRLENVEELRTTVIKYIEETEEPSLSGFLEEIALYTDLDGLEEGEDAVVMMTLHSAKGLEFPYVFIAGMEEGIFPGQQAVYEPKEIEEERRLAYVGITRAKKKLYLTSAAQRMLFGRTTRNRRSRFEGEIPQQLTDQQDDALRSWQQTGRAGLSGGHGTAPAAKTVAPPRPLPSKPTGEAFNLRAGDRVSHRVFGEGMVLSVTPMGGDHLVEIAFDKVGTKRIMATFAKLNKL